MEGELKRTSAFLVCNSALRQEIIFGLRTEMVESLSFESLEATGDWNQQLCINRIVVNLLCEGEGKYQRDRNEPKVKRTREHILFTFYC